MLSDILDNRLYKSILFVVTVKRNVNSNWFKPKSEFTGSDNLNVQKLSLTSVTTWSGWSKNAIRNLSLWLSWLLSSALALIPGRFLPCGDILRVQRLGLMIDLPGGLTNLSVLLYSRPWSIIVNKYITKSAKENPLEQIPKDNRSDVSRVLYQRNHTGCTWFSPAN